ncbi:hypothetical protein RHMOL_Rhmol03G0028200 [Rhododendron molle]|uniref:Uncharacterized protein n=1 Tax=Rhododendron molle TaxID=49168 RepID=A0ACC0P9M3_RHOML|nr:hypothetical protein RHMOL_Rhmol03G0028200 [Rhododendron molle]
MDQPPQLQPPETFYLRDLTIWPHGFAILVHSPLISQVDTNFSQGTKLLFCYLISLFAFPLLSASHRLHPPRRLSRAPLHHPPLVFSRRGPLRRCSSRVFEQLISFADTTPIVDEMVMLLASLFVSLYLLHTDDASLWRLAPLPEPVYGAVVAAMEKCKLVIWGVNGVFSYLLICILQVIIFSDLLAHGLGCWLARFNLRAGMFLLLVV